jgi:hypothetical protein
MARYGQEVRIAGGMKEFLGRLGTIIGEEGTRPRITALGCMSRSRSPASAK